MKLQDLFEQSITPEQLGELMPHLRSYVGNTHLDDEGQAGKLKLTQLFKSPAAKVLMYHGKMERVVFSYQGEPRITFNLATKGPKSKGIHSFFKMDDGGSALEDFMDQDDDDRPTGRVIIEQVGEGLDFGKIHMLYEKLGERQRKKLGIDERDMMFIQRADTWGEVLAPYYPTAKLGSDR